MRTPIVFLLVLNLVGSNGFCAVAGPLPERIINQCSNLTLSAPIEACLTAVRGLSKQELDAITTYIDERPDAKAIKRAANQLLIRINNREYLTIQDLKNSALSTQRYACIDGCVGAVLFVAMILAGYLGYKLAKQDSQMKEIIDHSRENERSSSRVQQPAEANR